MNQADKTPIEKKQLLAQFKAGPENDDKLDQETEAKLNFERRHIGDHALCQKEPMGCGAYDTCMGDGVQ